MQTLKKQILLVQTEFDQALGRIQSLADFEVCRVKFMGKEGLVAALFLHIKTLNVEDKKQVVPVLQDFKKYVEERLEFIKKSLIEKMAQEAQLKRKHFDVTAYTPLQPKGHLHPYTQFVEEVENIFMSMGFSVLAGPYVETDFYNFGAINIPKDHPARDMYDTFWLNKENYLLRTHTSSVQVHAMESQKPPIAGIVPGYAFRYESVDATHDVQFMQCEGFLIDKNVTMANLFATAQEFLKKLLQVKELDIRIRPGFFPFVEPGVEIDMRCPFCTAGCSVCKQSTWVEVFPGGMIHPNVLRAGGINPEEYSGFAFGFGLTRLAMLKYKINDIRLFMGGNLKFLDQF